MKLTNSIRDSYVRAVMNDVPQIDNSEKMRKIVLADAVAQLPPKVRALWNDEATRSYVNIDWYGGRYSGTSVEVPASSATSFALTDKAAAAVAELTAAAKNQDNTRAALAQKIKAAAYSVHTREALVKLLPEFEKYLPIDETAALCTLPAVANVMADFVKAGWPKDAKKTRVTPA